MRNLRERSTALYTRASPADDLPRVTVTDGKAARRSAAQNLAVIITFLLSGIVSLLGFYSLFCYLTGRPLLPSREGGVDLRAYSPNWTTRLDAVRPYITGGGSASLEELKQSALRKCSEAESVCQDVIEPFILGSPDATREEIRRQRRTRFKCGYEIRSCELLVERVKVALLAEGGGVEESASKPFVSACSELCWEHGTCNEELKRCDCLGDYRGAECQKRALPSCWIGGGRVKTPCNGDGGATCACLLECEALDITTTRVSIDRGLFEPELCLNANPPEEETTAEAWTLALKEEVAAIYSAPVVVLKTDGEGHETGKRTERDSQPRFEATSPFDCPMNCSGHGFCNKETMSCWCPAIYSGEYCEGPRPEAPFGCLNKCSGRGKCTGGVCKCNQGHFGIDCSIFPVPEGKSKTSKDKFGLVRRKPFPASYAAAEGNVSSSEREARPRIYAYELPVNLLARLFEHGMSQLPGDRPLEVAESLLFYEALLASKYRTANAEEADFFFVPLQMRLHGKREEAITEVIEYISTTWPYWTKHRGADHVFVMGEDWGLCNAAPYGWREAHLKHAIGITTWTYQRNMFGGRIDPCFIRGQDIGIPVTVGKSALAQSPWVKAGAGATDAAFDSRDLLVYYLEEHQNLPSYRPKPGFIGLPEHYREPGLHKYKYSFGIRQKLIARFSGKRGDGVKVILKAESKEQVYADMARAKFCLAPPGWGVGSLATLSIVFGCVPVFFKTNETYPFGGDVINWNDLSVSINLDDIDDTIEILRSVPETAIKLRQQAIAKTWPRLIWLSPQWDPLSSVSDSEASPGGAVLEDAAKTALMAQIIEKGAFQTVIDVLKNRLEGNIMTREGEGTDQDWLEEQVIPKDLSGTEGGWTGAAGGEGGAGQVAGGEGQGEQQGREEEGKDKLRGWNWGADGALP
eukprot:TRINITY_DN13433_c0_g1_i1.p1 TRINITY_DN13433_c0_g1~~TRINITY_DN13433_c0_g1_i1.p1  ORF type:complete len:919 (+),score=144.18 TRINITY_DN13433_c0_g1_i1:328-3084(+)